MDLIRAHVLLLDSPAQLAIIGGGEDKKKGPEGPRNLVSRVFVFVSRNPGLDGLDTGK